MVTKDEDKELPIPVKWRHTLYKVVECLVKNDHHSISKIPLVSKLPETTSIQINSYIEDYGEELISLPEDAWDSSVYFGKEVIGMFQWIYGRETKVIATWF